MITVKAFNNPCHGVEFPVPAKNEKENLVFILLIASYDNEIPNSSSKLSEGLFVHTARKSAAAGISRQMTLLSSSLESTIRRLPFSEVFRNCHEIFS